MKPQDVGAAIAERRQTLKLSMRDAATLGGLSVTAWSDLEKGKRPPSLATQRAVAKAIGWRLDWYDVLSSARRRDQRSLLPTEIAAADTAEASATRPTIEDLDRKLDELRELVHQLVGRRQRRSLEGDRTPTEMPRPALKGRRG